VCLLYYQASWAAPVRATGTVKSEENERKRNLEKGGNRDWREGLERIVKKAGKRD
jgi:hypothetical protein